MEQLESGNAAKTFRVCETVAAKSPVDIVSHSLSGTYDYLQVALNRSIVYIYYIILLSLRLI